MFVLGDSDELVRFSLFKNMFDSCPADRKKLQLDPEAAHATPRSEKCIRNAFEFLGAELPAPERAQEEDSESAQQMEEWEETINVGEQTKALLMNLTRCDFDDADPRAGPPFESVDDSCIFGEKRNFRKQKRPVRANILGLKVVREMIPQTKSGTRPVPSD